jgi:predicted adenine nucleotide alpha hydrolase (AANH) superfamily ATPase
MRTHLVLHICCAPDEAWVVKSLAGSYTMHCFFCNPNIRPPEEYQKRQAEAHRVAELFDVDYAADIYEPQAWEEAVASFQDSPEGGARCGACFLLRLRRTARYCSMQGLERFTTVMSVSPHKNVLQLNQAGHRAANEHGVLYEEFNFKKQDGFRKSIILSNELRLYRQDYCGCRLSITERDERLRRHVTESNAAPDNSQVAIRNS